MKCNTSAVRCERAVRAFATIAAIMIGTSLLPVTGCGGTILPSVALVVDLHRPKADAKGVSEAIDEFLIARGFTRQDKDAYDELTLQDTVRHYSGGNLLVSVALDQPGRVFIRVSERSETFSEDAGRFVDDLSDALDRRYPGAIHRE